ncbi:hypothetical protein [Nonomuraea sp. SYSU D8015]|uniref:hypothetical protein n=1 Tax=Nonomuraea sp. SYSU D8015 TaxID=2593644 RepID=UPI0016615773|nr:hypothetical protein [Nonomuraea sp. SYSU D8015]
MKRLRAILFQQSDAAWRAGATRLALAGAIAVTIAKLPKGRFFQEHRDTMERLRGRPGRLPPLSARGYELLRAGTLASVAVWGVTGRRRAGLLAAAQFFWLNGHVAEFFPGSWNYNSHLNVNLLVLGAVDTSSEFALKPRPATADGVRRQSMALAFMQLGSGVLYAQSALSKLRYGGSEWFTSGRTLEGSIALLGTPAGHRVYPHKSLIKTMSWGTLAFELSFLPALVLGWRHRKALGVAAVAFHLAVSRFMGISFWHLWCQYPALFIVPSPGERALRTSRNADR